MYFTTPLEVPETETPLTVTYFGYIKSAAEAVYVVEATRLGNLKSIHQRLTVAQRKNIRSGSVFVWEQNLSGIQRWTDGKNWSASRYVDHFLVYKELKPKPSKDPKKKVNNDLNNSITQGLSKRSISISTIDGKRYHLINYYTDEDVFLKVLNLPSQDPSLKVLNVPRNYYFRENSIENIIEFINIEPSNFKVTTPGNNINSIANLLNYEEPKPAFTASDPISEHNNAAFLTKERRALTDASEAFPVAINPSTLKIKQYATPNKVPRIGNIKFNSKEGSYHSEDKRQLDLLKSNLDL